MTYGFNSYRLYCESFHGWFNLLLEQINNIKWCLRLNIFKIRYKYFLSCVSFLTNTYETSILLFTQVVITVIKVILYVPSNKSYRNQTILLRKTGHWLIPLIQRNLGRNNGILIIIRSCRTKICREKFIWWNQIFFSALCQQT